jgi:hypothetical protein
VRSGAEALELCPTGPFQFALPLVQRVVGFEGADAIARQLQTLICRLRATVFAVHSLPTRSCTYGQPGTLFPWLHNLTFSARSFGRLRPFGVVRPYMDSAAALPRVACLLNGFPDFVQCWPIAQPLPDSSMVIVARPARNECLRPVARRIGERQVQSPGTSSGIRSFSRFWTAISPESPAAARARVDSSSSLHRAFWSIAARFGRFRFPVACSRLVFVTRTGIQGFEPRVDAWFGAGFRPLAKLASPVGFPLSRVLPR